MQLWRRMSAGARRAVLALSGTAAVAACDAGMTTAVRAPIVKVETPSVEIATGDTARLVATATDGAPLTWSSADASVARVDPQGLVTAISPGETEMELLCWLGAIHVRVPAGVDERGKIVDCNAYAERACEGSLSK